jgi:hypothetical protein
VNRGATRVGALVLGLASLGCGGSSAAPVGDGGTAGTSGGETTAGPHGCTNIEGSCSSNMGLSCEEFAGYPAATVSNFMKGCNHPNQVWSTSPCGTATSVGGCAVSTNGVCGVIWSFPPVTAADLQSSCNGLHQMFVTP